MLGPQSVQLSHATRGQPKPCSNNIPEPLNSMGLLQSPFPLQPRRPAFALLETLLQAPREFATLHGEQVVTRLPSPSTLLWNSAFGEKATHDVQHRYDYLPPPRSNFRTTRCTSRSAGNSFKLDPFLSKNTDNKHVCGVTAASIAPVLQATIHPGRQLLQNTLEVTFKLITKK